MTTRDTFQYVVGATDLARAVAFYRTLFDREPVRVTDAVADFALPDPPVLVTVVRRDRVVPTNAPGFRLPDRAAVLALRDRLARLGLKTHTQECVHCGYNEQFKVHVGDPDGNYWSAYVVEQQVHPTAIHRCLEGPEAVLPPDPVVASWGLTAGTPAPAVIPHSDGSLDEVRLPPAALALAAEAFRAVRAGGAVRVEGSGGVSGALAALGAAGFVGLEARDTVVTGFRPELTAPDKTRLVMYKGPFRSGRDDLGNVYPRGRRVWVTEAAWTLLRRGSCAEQFLFLFPFGYPARGPVRPPAAVLEEVGP